MGTVQMLYGRGKFTGWPLRFESFTQELDMDKRLEGQGAQALPRLGVGLKGETVGCINQQKDREREEEV